MWTKHHIDRINISKRNDENVNTRLAEILNYVPKHIKTMLSKTFEVTSEGIQEIRIRNSSPLIIETLSGSFAVLPDGSVSPAVGGAYIIGDTDLRQIFQAVCENSVYAFVDDIRQGFITIKGGHRVGFAGRVVVNNGKIENFREISSLNIRVSREVIGAANDILDRILTPGGVKNTLLVSPPMGGKTTILRDLARQISNSGIKTVIIDDRGELAAMYRGVPQNDVGVQTDVIENAPKAEAVVMMLRAMSPQMIVTDEISTMVDANAIKECFGTGVSVVGSTHGGSIEEVLRRETIKGLIGGNGFKQIVFLYKDGTGLNTKILSKVMEVN